MSVADMRGMCCGNVGYVSVAEIRGICCGNVGYIVGMGRSYVLQNWG